MVAAAEGPGAAAIEPDAEPTPEVLLESVATEERPIEPIVAEAAPEVVLDPAASVDGPDAACESRTVGDESPVVGSAIDPQATAEPTVEGHEAEATPSAAADDEQGPSPRSSLFLRMIHLDDVVSFLGVRPKDRIEDGSDGAGAGTVAADRRRREGDPPSPIAVLRAG